MKTLKVRITFTEEVLGTLPPDEDIYENYIASKSPVPVGMDEKEYLDLVDDRTTIFPKMADGTPFFWDYQLKGFFKDTCGALQRCKGEEISKESCKLKAYKKIIDGCIFTKPRQIPINLNGMKMGTCQRPLRGQTPKGETVSLASSETVPDGSTIEFEVECLSDKYAPTVIEWLEYGKYRGLGQWRNSGKGRFNYEIIED